jgi:pyruvate/2-oxoglutarate dehydrogenase complex dihydrolipoamide dehydrogenase (E3) component
MAARRSNDRPGRRLSRAALSPRWRRQRFDPSAIPWVTFATPEVARVGISEADAAGHGRRVAFLPMAKVDRAIVTGQTAGFVKLIAGPRPVLRGVGGGRVLGATIVAARAGDMIHEPALAMRTGMFTGRLAQTVHAYPTWSVAVRQAAAQFFFEINGRRARPARPGSGD